MLISHKNTGTIGDLATSFPVLSELSKKIGPLDFTFPIVYETQYNGFKEFLEYQDFVNKIDFDDREGDFDLKCPPIPIDGCRGPYQTCFVKTKVEEFFKIEINIHNDFCLKVPHIKIDESIIQKNVIVERSKTLVMTKSNLFDNHEKNYWLSTTSSDNIGDSLIYNINVCLQNRKKIFATPTGLTVLLQFFKKEIKIIALDYQGIDSWNFAFFQENKNLEFIDFTNGIDNNELFI